MREVTRSIYLRGHFKSLLKNDYIRGIVIELTYFNILSYNIYIYISL